MPIGTGILYAGMNDARVHDNWIFDNWRDGAMLFAVPDAFTNGGGAEGDIFPGVSCPGAPQNGISTSCGNRFFDNRIGRAPPRLPVPATPSTCSATSTRPTTAKRGDAQRHRLLVGRVLPGATPGTAGSTTRGPDGTAASVTGPGAAGRQPAAQPQVLPSNCGTSVGSNDPAKLAYLVECGNGPDEDTGPIDCDWWTLPPRPGSGAARRAAKPRAIAAAASPTAAEEPHEHGAGHSHAGHTH